VVSLLVHLAIGAAVVLVPLFLQDVLPPLSRDAVRAFLVEPEIMPPPPPPPPPPAAGLRPALRAPAPPPEVDPGRFVAPIEVPNEIAAPAVESFDLGVEGGVPGGVEGGVPGGVVGGVVGGLPQATLAPAEPPAVRVGGDLKAPRLVKDVKPEYPELALMARVSTIVFLEARVDTQGRVQEVKVLRGHPLFDEAAVGAVKQWRYQPLLLNGVPTPFVLTVTVHFRVTSPNN
jgi:protein TonB